MSEPQDAPERTTPLRKQHEALGARFIGFSGFQMPLQFEGILAEHRAVREDVGIFDVSHMSNLTVPLDQAPELARALGADITRLDQGQAKYTVCLREDGTILDDLVVFCLPDTFHIVPNAGQNRTVARALEATGCTVEDLTDQRCILAIQGPRSRELIEQTVGEDHLADRFRCAPLHGDGVVSGTGYTGEKGVEWIVPPATASKAFERMVEAGATPCGLGARDTLRMEKGYCLAGNEFDPPVTPAEAQLMWAVDMDHSFIGREAVQARLDEGPEVVLAGLKLTGRGVPRRGCTVVAEGASVGRVSSGTMSPSLQEGIALAYVAPQAAQPGTEVAVEVRSRTLPARIQELGFL